MRNNWRFSFFVLGLIAMTCTVFAGCLDASEKDAKLENTYLDSSRKRVVVTNEDFQNTPKKATAIKAELLVNEKDKQSWDTVFEVLKRDEDIADKRLLSDLTSMKSDLRLIAISRLTNMGSRGYDLLLESVQSAKTAIELECALDGFLLAFLKTEIKPEQSDKIRKFLKKTIREYDGTIQDKALRMLAQIANEADLEMLAEFLNIDDDITRLLIYRNLRATTSNHVLSKIAKHLEDETLAVRVYAVNLLRQITGKYFSYNPGGELISRQIQAIRWQTYIQNSNKFTTNTLR